jgi:hypothetical protein
MPYVPKLDLSKYDLLAAKDKLFAYICQKAKSWGMDPNVECALLSPKQSDDLGYGRQWRVMWESGSYNWGIDLSGGGVTFVKYDGPWDQSQPEIIMGAPDDWYLQPYYSFDVGFVPTTTYADFDDESNTIITVTNFVSKQLMCEIARHPKILQTIERRRFEELIAELFHGFGYDVELTGRTRDGGKDIIAVKNVDSINLRYLIECKRPEPGNPVAVSTIRELLGVKADDPATKALLVTTTDFTADARALIQRHCWHLEGKIYNDIVSWINNYNRIKGIEL